MCKGIETLEVEGASRRVLKELVSHYNQLDVEQTKRAAAIEEFGLETRDRGEKYNARIYKLETAVPEIADLRKKIARLQTIQEETAARNEVLSDDLKYRISSSQDTLQSRIDQIGTLDERVKMIEAQCDRVQKVTLDTKKEIYDAATKQKMETLTVQNSLTGYEARLDKTIEDAKYWLETYTAAFKAHDKDMQGLRTELSGRLGTVIDACALRVSITDMTLNFKTLNDMLFVKLRVLVNKFLQISV